MLQRRLRRRIRRQGCSVSNAADPLHHLAASFRCPVFVDTSRFPPRPHCIHIYRAASPLRVRVCVFLKFQLRKNPKPRKHPVTYIFVTFLFLFSSLSKTLKTKVLKSAPLVIGEMLLIHGVSSTSPSTSGS